MISRACGNPAFSRFSHDAAFNAFIIIHVPYLVQEMEVHLCSRFRLITKRVQIFSLTVEPTFSSVWRSSRKLKSPNIKYGTFSNWSVSNLQ